MAKYGSRHGMAASIKRHQASLAIEISEKQVRLDRRARASSKKSLAPCA